jgi:hypothetical protein
LTILIPFLILLTIVLIWNNKKRKAYKQRIVELEKPKLKNIKSYCIDNKTIERILNELESIEQSELFLSKDFSLRFLAKKLDTDAAYLSKLINIKRKPLSHT